MSIYSKCVVSAIGRKGVFLPQFSEMCTSHFKSKLATLMGSVAKKQRRPQNGLIYYDDDNHDTTPKRRTTDSQHLHTSITTTSSGFSTRTCRLTAANPRTTGNRLSASAPHQLDDVSATNFYSAADTGREFNLEEEGEMGLLETLHPESFTDIHDYLDVRKFRKHTASVGKHFYELTATLLTYHKDYPLHDWAKNSIDEWLAELLCHEGRGDYADETCSSCKKRGTLHRCDDCWDPCFYCEDCTKARHYSYPFHRIRVCRRPHPILLLVTP